MSTYIAGNRAVKIESMEPIKKYSANPLLSNSLYLANDFKPNTIPIAAY